MRLLLDTHVFLCCPSDRMLVAQAQQERLVLVTHDGTLTRYGISLLLT